MNVPRWIFVVLILLNALLAIAFLVAQGYESIIAPCDPRVGCPGESVAQPLGGAIAAGLAFAGTALGWAMRDRMPPAAFVVPPLLAALFALLVVRGQTDRWVMPLWAPLLALALVDSIMLVLVSVGKKPAAPPVA